MKNRKRVPFVICPDIRDLNGAKPWERECPYNHPLPLNYTPNISIAVSRGNVKIELVASNYLNLKVQNHRRPEERLHNKVRGGERAEKVEEGQGLSKKFKGG